MRKIIHIEGMSCGGCVARVKKALEGIPGIESVNVELEAKRAEVTGPEEVLQEEQLREAISKLGYTVKGVD